MIEHKTIQKEISQKFPNVKFEEYREMLSVLCGKADFLNLMKFLKENSQLQFDYLTDVTGVDFLKQEREPRFDIVYHLYSFKNNQRLRVKLGVPEEDVDVPSMAAIWKAAIWLEREVFEMFGINFVDHPDLRRLLTPDMFDGNPLRKDYPLRGRGERDSILDLK